MILRGNVHIKICSQKAYVSTDIKTTQCTCLVLNTHGLDCCWTGCTDRPFWGFLLDEASKIWFLLDEASIWFLLDEASKRFLLDEASKIWWISLYGLPRWWEWWGKDLTAHATSPSPHLNPLHTVKCSVLPMLLGSNLGCGFIRTCSSYSIYFN